MSTAASRPPLLLPCGGLLTCGSTTFRYAETIHKPCLTALAHHHTALSGSADQLRLICFHAKNSGNHPDSRVRIHGAPGDVPGRPGHTGCVPTRPSPTALPLLPTPPPSDPGREPASQIPDEVVDTLRWAIRTADREHLNRTRSQGSAIVGERLGLARNKVNRILQGRQKLLKAVDLDRVLVRLGLAGVIDLPQAS